MTAAKPSRAPPGATTTGHPIGDAVLPSALRLVAAVHEGDTAGITDAIGAAYVAADNDYWATALMIVLAGLVPDDRTPSELLAWTA